MSEVNRSVYPAGTTGLHGLEVCSYHLDHFLDDEPWNDSIAIAQSMSERAPFNVIDFITTLDGGLTFTVQESRREVQKIALAYIGSGTNFGQQNQYYNGSVSGVNISDPGGIYYSYATLRKTARTSFVQSCQNYYRPAQYDILTGADLQSILGVICVGYDDGQTMSSFKYYLDHKDDPSFTYYPSSIFMLGLYGNTGDSNARRGIAPIDLSEAEVKYWTYSGSPAAHSTSSVKCYQAFPWAVSGGYTCIDAGANPLKVPIFSPALIFPLIGCINGNRGYLYTWATSPAVSSTQATVIIGGGNGTMYTPYKDGAFLKIHLLPAAFDRVFSTAATYGIPFTTEFPADAHSLFSTEGITTYMPIANAGGYYDGQFETLTIDDTVSRDLSPANRELWEGGIHAPYNGRAYDPTIPIPVDQIDLTQPSVSPIGSFNKTYILNKQEVDAIQAYIYGADDSTLENFLKGISNFGANPMDAFISLHMWPFNVREFVTASATAQVTVGRTPISDATYGDVIGFIMPTNAKAVVDCGTYRIKPKFNSFLDYEPYTTINLYIPFVGTVDLAPSLYMGKRVNVRLICDWVTGATTAVVYADGIPLVYQQGVGAVSISMTGDNHSKTAGDVIGGVIGAAGSAVGAVAAAKTGNFGTAAQFAGKAVEMGSQAFMDYGKTDFTQAGSSSPMCSLYMPMYCYLTISTPKLLIDGEDLAQWAHGVGYADSRVSTLAAEGSSGDGIVMGSPVRISFTGSVQPTPGEIDRILQMLSEGVFPS